MKKGILSLLIWGLPFLLLAQNDTLHGINWAAGLTWEQVKVKAKQEKKYIFVDCYTTWCGPCKIMDKIVYPNKKVGESINEKFIAVRAQMDETKGDDERIKSWYKDSKFIKEEYKPEGYPCFLFFSPDGQLVFRDVGLKYAETFVAMAKEALSDPNEKYLRNLQKFRDGQLKYEEMPSLVRMAKKNKESQAMVLKIATVYKQEYLEKLSNELALTKDNLFFLAQFPDVINTQDRFFRFFYEQPDKADSIINRMVAGKIDKVSMRIVLYVIKKEEISDRIYNNIGKPIIKPEPDWNNITKNITAKYGISYTNKLLPDEQIAYYESSGGWGQYAYYVNQKIKMMPPRAKGRWFGGVYGDAWMLNHYAWSMFQGCSNNSVLKKAIPWINYAIRLEDIEVAKGYYLDTKANLLYKIGKKKQAIQFQETAISLLKGDLQALKESEATLHSMKEGIAKGKDKSE